MNIQRSCGVFLHPTSLPSPFGVGDLGDNAFRWVDTLARFNHTVWQLCPLGPTGYGNSPYQCLSSFAGNPVLISPRKLLEDGMLMQSDLDSYPRFSEYRASFDEVRIEKHRLFEVAFARTKSSKEFEKFIESHKWWLDTYSVFMALKEHFEGRPWFEWPKDLRLHKEDAIEEIRPRISERVRYHQFVQFLFFAQWGRLKAHAEERGVKIVGDIPYYVALDSADIWGSPELFELDSKGQPSRVAGVPPDYFSATGQLWGNPLFRWGRMKKDGYAWWKARMRAALDMVDMVRIDHFRGFESYWAVPAGSTTAENGKWEKGPGMTFFRSLEKDFGELPLIAEDLGMITEDVWILRDNAKIPGMKVLQFAFDDNPDNPYLPYNYEHRSLVYTGTHDNNTSIGWYNSLGDREKHLVRVYMGCGDDRFLDTFLRLAYSSCAEMCIVPLQDILGLDESHRFNTPGTGQGNWDWRFTWEMLDESRMGMVAEFAWTYGRFPRENK